MSIKISCLVPTRGRVSGMNKFVDSIFNTASNPDNIEIIFYIDNDDMPSKECADNLKGRYNIKYIFKPTIIQSQTINECAKEAIGDIFFLGADDVVVSTKNWDELIINAFNGIEDKIALFYGYDGRQPAKLLGTHPFLHRKWLDVVGHLFPSNFHKGYSDQWVNKIAVKLKRHFFINIFTNHLHPGPIEKILRKNILKEYGKEYNDLRLGNIICENKKENETIYKLFNIVESGYKDDTYLNNKTEKQKESHDMWASEQTKMGRNSDYEKLQHYIDQYQRNKLNTFASSLTINDYI